MSHGHSHAEEAEHQDHHAQDPFNKRVALTMVIIAVILAGVKVVGHRAHNQTLSLQIESGVSHTRETDLWNLFQAQKIRQHQYETQATALTIIAREGKYSDKAKEDITKLKERAAGYKKEAEEWKAKAESWQQKGLKQMEDSEHMHHLCDYFDLGEMAVEIGLVLCSLAILVKMRFFWIAGIVAALIGAGIAGVGLLPARHDKEHPAHSSRVEPDAF